MIVEIFYIDVNAFRKKLTKSFCDKPISCVVYASFVGFNNILDRFMDLGDFNIIYVLLKCVNWDEVESSLGHI